FAPAAWAGVPEPSITLFGKVFNQSNAQVTSGALRWTYTPPLGGTPVVINSELAPVFSGGEMFSYVVEIPCEQPVSGFPATANTLQLTGTPTTWTRAARVQNVNALLVSAPGQVSLSIAHRGIAERVDL